MFHSLVIIDYVAEAIPFKDLFSLIYVNVVSQYSTPLYICIHIVGNCKFICALCKRK